MSTASTLLPDMVYLLGQAGYGTYGTTIFKGPRAVLPDAIPATFRALITLTRTGGQGDEGTHNLSRETIAYERPSVQVVCRSDRPQDAEDVANELFSTTFNFYDRLVNGTWWRMCSPKQEPFPLSVDEKGRVRIVFNLDTVKRVSSLTS